MMEKDDGRKLFNCGPKEKVLDDPVAEAKRLKANQASREYKRRKRALEKQQEKCFDELNGFGDEDVNGIRPVDERRYVKCFHSGYIGEIPSRAYVRRMTGLSLKQISVLQKRTGLKPYPAVSNKEADEDFAERWEKGDIY